MNVTVSGSSYWKKKAYVPSIMFNALWLYVLTTSCDKIKQPGSVSALNIMHVLKCKVWNL